MKKIIQIMDRIIRTLLALLFGAVAFCVMVQIVARYIPIIQAPWTDELTRLFFLYVVMLSAPWAILSHQYASIDIITSHLGEKMRIIIDIVVDIIISVIAVIGVLQAKLFFVVGTVSKSTSLQLNLGLFYIVPLVIFVFTVACCVVDIVSQIKGLRGGGEK